MTKDAIDAAEAMQARLRAALKDAMRGKRALDIRVIRLLVAAIDDAQALPLDEQRPRFDPRDFGDGSAEASRRTLGDDDLQSILSREIAERHNAAAEMERVGRPDEAANLRAEADKVAGFLVPG